MTVRGPFYLTSAAVRQYAELIGYDVTSTDAFDDAEEELANRCARAKLKREQDNGLQLWRLAKDGGLGRFRLLVSTAPRPGGNLPQVVQVLPEHSSGRGT